MKGLYCDIRLMHFDKTQIQTTEPGPLSDLEKSIVYGHFTRFRRTDRKVIWIVQCRLCSVRYVRNAREKSGNRQSGKKLVTLMFVFPVGHNVNKAPDCKQ